MKHLTEAQVLGFWMPDFASESEFSNILAHLAQCQTCRGQVWAGAQTMMCLTDMVMAIHGPQPPMPSSAAHPDDNAIAKIAGEAVAKMVKNPDPSYRWTSVELFGTPRFGDIANLSSCDECVRCFNTLSSVLMGMTARMPNANREHIEAVQRVLLWLAKVKEAVLRLRGVEQKSPIEQAMRN